MPTYLAVIHKNKDSEYGVSFPDFPGCVARGITVATAICRARSTLQLHVAEIVEDGKVIPQGYSPDVVVLADIHIDLSLLKPNPEVELRKERQRLEKTAKKAGVPCWIPRYHLADYIINGTLGPTQFGFNLMSNNLSAFITYNQTQCLITQDQLSKTLGWLSAEAPSDSWGSPEKVQAWQDHQGLRGLKESR